MTAGRPHVSDAQRRALLVRRHHLDRGAGSIIEATRSVYALHSSDPVTPFLALWARVPEIGIEDVERSLYGARDLWRMHAMRRTIFVVEHGDAGALLSGAARAIAQKERDRLVGWIAADVFSSAHDPRAAAERLLTDLGERALSAVASAGVAVTTRELGVLVPELMTRVTLGSGKWSQTAAISSRLLMLLAMEGKIVRGAPLGSWLASQYRWSSIAAWFGAAPDLPDVEAARTEIVRRYLETHAPVTEVDLRWWTGWSKRDVLNAIAPLLVVEVDLDDGLTGLVLPSQTEGVAEVAPLDGAPVVTLLPPLDSSPMGWKHRGWFLDGHHIPMLYDRNGNVGPTIWVDGRIVGGWGQRTEDGLVRTRLLNEVGSDVAARVEAESHALSSWCGGVGTSPRFPTPLQRELAD